MKIIYVLMTATILASSLMGCQENLLKSSTEETEYPESTMKGVRPPTFSSDFDKLERYALLIGNADYDGEALSKLKTPLKDVEEMKEILEKSGMWKVETLLNAKSEREMKEKIIEFTTKHTGKILLFFYTGHGVQTDNLSYLLPTRQLFYSDADVRDEALKVDYVLEKFADARSKLSIIILDACRDNKLARSKGIGEKGLAPPRFSLSNDYYIIYANKSGSVALENEKEQNSYLTKGLLKAMEDFGKQPIEDILSETKDRVMKATEDKQIPEYMVSPPREKFCFFGCLTSKIDDTPPDPTKTTEKNPVDETEPEPEKPNPLSSECKRLIAKVESVDGGILLPKEQQFFDSNCGRRS